LIDQTLDESHCLALGDYSRPGLEIELNYCRLTNAGTSNLAEVLGRNQGPTKLAHCRADCSVLADGLRGNSRLKSFRQHGFSNPEVNKREVLAIASALRENKGLVDWVLTLALSRRTTNGGALYVMLSKQTHPTLEVLDLTLALTVAATIPAVITSRMQAFLDVMKMSVSIHTIHWCRHYSKHELFRGSVIPYLETNRLRPRLLALQKIRPMPYLVKVLGRALLSASIDVNRFWMLLSGNAEVVFPSTSAMTTPATNLHTPATTADTSLAAADAAISLTTGAISIISVSAVGTADTPAVGQKRKAHP
jgi:hypothetical protein